MTQVIRIYPRLISKGPPRKPTWVARGNRPRAFAICSRASPGKTRRGNHSRGFPLLPPPSPNTPRPGHRPPSRHQPNSPLPSSRLIPRGRGPPREKNPWTGENPVPLMRRTRADGLRNSLGLRLPIWRKKWTFSPSPRPGFLLQCSMGSL